MQELIVYRNPFEAFIWKVITSPVLWLVSLSCFCTVIIALSFESHTVDIKKKYLRIGFQSAMAKPARTCMGRNLEVNS